MTSPWKCDFTIGATLSLCDDGWRSLQGFSVRVFLNHFKTEPEDCTSKSLRFSCRERNSLIVPFPYSSWSLILSCQIPSTASEASFHISFHIHPEHVGSDKLVGICMKMLLLPPVRPYWPPHKPDSPPLVGSEEEGTNIAAQATFTEGNLGKSTRKGVNFLQASLFPVLQRLQVSRQGQTGMAAVDWSLGLLITAELRASWKLLLCYVRCI